VRIALDATYSVGSKPTGVAVYSREILWGLAQRHPEASYSFCYRSHRFFRSFEAFLPRRAQRLPMFESWAPPSQIFHGLNQRLPNLSGKRRLVTTFHDLFVLTSEYSSPEFRARFAAQARDAAQRSDLIITVSAFTASQVVELLGIERSRIRVIHHGAYHPSAAQLSSLTKRQPFILSVGAIQTRKNTGRLIQAFEQLPAGWRLVLAGSPTGFGSEEILAQIAASPRRADIQVLGYVSQSRLEALYSRAALFAFPSLDEGFGIPVMEAMAWGVPVVTSNRSALLEISGDAAFQVDPTNVEELRHTLQTLIDQPSLREQMAQRGFAHAAPFTWDRAVDQTWTVYHELLDR
jgi:glycosyltransferase involved in cell wall biosynthesis